MTVDPVRSARSRVAAAARLKRDVRPFQAKLRLEKILRELASLPLELLSQEDRDRLRAAAGAAPTTSVDEVVGTRWRSKETKKSFVVEASHFDAYVVRYDYTDRLGIVGMGPLLHTSKYERDEDA